MTVPELIKNFNDNYKEIELYCKKANILKNNKIQNEIILSELYLHLYKYRNDIDNVSVLLAYSKKFIKSNINWSKTSINKENMIYATKTDVSNNNGADDFINHLTETDNSYHLIEIIKEEYVNTLDIYSKRLFHIYHNLNITTAKQLQVYLNIKHTASYVIKKETKIINDNYEIYVKNNINKFIYI